MRNLTWRPLITMGGYVEFSVFFACFNLVLNFYAATVTLLGVIAHFLIFPLVSCTLFGILVRFRLPKPKDSATRNIFGSGWGAYKSISPNSKLENSTYSMKVVAHRACGLDAPENSLSALQKIKKEGITAVEFDVMLTADCVPVVFHDSNLNRMTDVCKNIEEATYEEIKNLDISIKHPFGKNFKNERIPTLNAYVDYCLENEIRMFIDLKNGDKNLTQIINDLFKQNPKMYEMAVVSSFNPILIYQIRAKDSNIVCSLAWRPYYHSHEEFVGATGPLRPRTSNLFHLLLLRILNHIHQWALWEFAYYLLGLSGLLLHKDMITRDLIEYWKKRGIQVIAWSVNLPTEKQYFEKILEITYLTDTVINS